MKKPDTGLNPQVILFLIVTILGGLAAPVSAQPFSVDVRFSHTHQSEGAVISGPVDLLDLHYGSSLGGEFQDAAGPAGNIDWQGWTRHDLGGTGNFSQIMKFLQDEDPCYNNSTCQVIFIDDNIVEPGTGGYKDPNWTYGPGGFSVNPIGGLLGPNNYIWNEIWSPELNVPVGHNAATLAFDVYVHEELESQWAGIFVVWHVRSYISGTWTPWRDRERHYHGGPNYFRVEEIVSDLLDPSATKVQIALGLKQESPPGYTGTESTPAPYLDNVEFLSYQIQGSTITMNETDMAQDVFSGNILGPNLAADSVPFARAYGSPAPVRARVVSDSGGPQAASYPRLHFSMLANPLYDAYRTSGWPVAGFVEGVSETFDANLYKFSLPSQWFFPGDRVHYYIEASVDGIVKTTLPASTTGFGDFSSGSPYPRSFIVRALPSVRTDGSGGYEQPEILWWDDGPYRSQAVYRTAFNALGYVNGMDYDIYVTNDPTARDLGTNISLGLGLGDKATLTDLSQGYQTVLYRSADLEYDTIASNDATLLGNWLAGPGTGLFVCGDNVVYDMVTNGNATTLAFVATTLGVSFQAKDLRTLTGPLDNFDVYDIGLDVVWPAFNFVSFLTGGCTPLKPEQRMRNNTFDAVTATTGSRVYSFLPPGNTPPSPWPQSAMTLNAPGGGTVLSMPFGLIFDPDKAGAPNSSRTELLNTVLTYFGHIPSGLPSPVPGAPGTTRAYPNYPNPFNPSTTIEFYNPVSGLVELAIYDLKGRMVRTLLHHELPAGPGKVVWNGKTDGGVPVSSGAYLFTLKTTEGVDQGRMVLLK